MSRNGALIAMVLAGAGWAAVFVAPELAPLAPALLLATGRFVAFGVVSLPQLRGVLAAGVPWGRVVAHGVTGSVLYYALVAVSVRLAGPTVAVATIGLVPVVLAALSARERARAGRRVGVAALLPALALVAVGQALVHGTGEAAGAGADPGSVLLGTGLALAAVASWSWYGLDSHRLLDERPELGRVLAGAQGLAAGALALPAGVVLLAVDGVPDQAMRALLVVLLLGLVSSWLTVRLWHAAAAHLSPVLVSQLMALETAWGFVFAALVAGEVPGPAALVGEVALVAGVVLAVVADRRPGAGARRAWRWPVVPGRRLGDRVR